MRQIETFSDYRLDAMCSYCGNNPDTRDHVPSKILLDAPLPANIPVVPCCNECNQSFSFDELYISCLIECVRCGTTNIENLKREKVKTALKKRSSLHRKICDSMIQSDGQIGFNVEIKRLENLILKLAKGHAKYENSEPMLTDPLHLAFKPLHLMSEDEIDSFMVCGETNKAPEVGSRAMQNFVFSNNNIFSHWTIVQQDNYLYSVEVGLGTTSVKILLLDYLAAEIIWED